MKDRKANRLEGYDYSEDGCYFVTICAQSREELFGEIIGGEMVLSEAGQMVERTWNELPEFYRGVETDHFQVMPNHVHGVIVITGNEFHHETVGTSPCACPDYIHPDAGQPQGGRTIPRRDCPYDIKPANKKRRPLSRGRLFESIRPGLPNAPEPRIKSAGGQTRPMRGC